MPYIDILNSENYYTDEYMKKKKKKPTNYHAIDMYDNFTFYSETRVLSYHDNNVGSDFAYISILSIFYFFFLEICRCLGGTPKGSLQITIHIFGQYHRSTLYT